MALPKHYSLQVIAYTAIIFVVMWWSGWKTEKTIYDSVVVRLEGEILFVTDPTRSQDFYRRVLAFTPITSESNGVSEMLLPDRSIVRLERAKAENRDHRAVLLIRVRNAIEKLHAELVRRSGQREFRNSEENYVVAMEQGRVSEIVRRRWGEEFVVSDFDGNRIVFHKPKRGRRYGE